MINEKLDTIIKHGIEVAEVTVFSVTIYALETVLIHMVLL
jgi:hypothetical protein